MGDLLGERVEPRHPIRLGNDERRKQSHDGGPCRNREVSLLLEQGQNRGGPLPELDPPHQAEAPDLPHLLRRQAGQDRGGQAAEPLSPLGQAFSDEDLERFPKLLKPYESLVKPPDVESLLVPDVWFRPKIVIETIASEITLSPTHPAGLDAVRKGSGMALRFPKFTGKIRDEKGPKDATTVKEIVEMYNLQKKRIAAAPGNV